MSSFNRSEFLFDLPPERIAQTPADQRDGSQLLVAEGNANIRHDRFHNIGQYLRAGDVLVLNQTKVINARCFGYKDNGVKIEVFVLGMPADPRRTQVLCKPAKRVKADTELTFPGCGVKAVAVSKGDQGRVILDFGNLDNLSKVLQQDGHLPLPPYIKRDSGPDPDDDNRYQTVFAKDLGAVAAPTAGLHFTDQLLQDLRTQEIETITITHHVGIGTFKPLIADDIRDHIMESESYRIGEQQAAALTQAKRNGRRIIAVGTTSTRCLESNYKDAFVPGSYNTDLYIFPGYTFKAIDALITNFHLPGSSLILLVSALMGHQRIMDIYHTALERDYRFYSYGDAMFLQP